MSNRALVGNASDQEQVKNARRLQEAKQRQLTSDYKQILSTPAGRRVLWNIVTGLRPTGRIWTGGADIQRNAVMTDASNALLETLESVSSDLVSIMREEARNESRHAQMNVKDEEKEEED